MQIVPSSYLMYCNSYSVIDINIDIGRLTNITNAQIIYFCYYSLTVDWIKLCIFTSNRCNVVKVITVSSVIVYMAQ